MMSSVLLDTVQDFAEGQFVGRRSPVGPAVQWSNELRISNSGS
jgi:hypothetical protein